MSEPTPQWITIAEMAALAGVSPAAVTNWRSRFDDFPIPLDDLERPADVDGRSVLFRRSDAVQWMTDRGKVVASRPNLVRQVAELLAQNTDGKGQGVAGGFEGAADSFGVVAYLLLERIEPGATSSDGRSTLAWAAARYRRCSASVRRRIAALVEEQLAGLASIVDQVDSVRSDFVTCVDDATYYDSPSVTDLLVRSVPLLSTIYDPCCGTGSLLAAAARARAATGDGDRRVILLGQEVEPGLAAGAHALLLAEGWDVDISCEDVLGPGGKGFAAVRSGPVTVVADPPLDLRLTEPLDAADERWAGVEGGLTSPLSAVQTSRSALPAWVAHGRWTLDSADRTESSANRVAMVVSSAWLGASRLANQPSRVRSLRRTLVDHGELEAVISLPEGSAGGQRTTSAIIVLRPGAGLGDPSNDGDSDVLFVDLGNQRFRPTASGPRLDEALVDRVGHALSRWRAGEEPADSDGGEGGPIWYGATAAAIRSTGYSLLPSVYRPRSTDQPNAADSADTDALLGEVARLESALRSQRTTSDDLALAQQSSAPTVTLADLERTGALQLLAGKSLARAVSAPPEDGGLGDRPVIVMPLAGPSFGRPSLVAADQLSAGPSRTGELRLNSFARGVSVFVPDGRTIDARFVLAWLESDAVQAELRRHSEGARERTNRSVAERVLRLLPAVLLPDLPTQRAIGDAWDTAQRLDAAVARLSARLAADRGQRLPTSLIDGSDA